ncbi:MAG TPA: hypothetical protein VMS12_03680 [Thermoanaerobaculia bacterium]|nr:hypothetical protein [Thermoanaerobaculia bacterium]
MKGLLKFSLLVALILSLFLATAAYGVHRLLFDKGVVSVHVAEKGRYGERVFVFLPAGLVNAVLALAPVGSFHHEIDDDFHQWLPVLQAVVSELDHYDDVVLLEVDDGGETVRIVKQDGHLRILVDSHDATVRVTIPPRTVHAAVRAFNRL